MRHAHTRSLLVAATVLAAAVTWAAAVRDVRAPEPVVLTGSLATTTGASASATWVCNAETSCGRGSATTGFRMSASFTPCPKDATGGLPATGGLACTSRSAALVPGTLLLGRVVKVNGLCRCVD